MDYSISYQNPYAGVTKQALLSFFELYPFNLNKVCCNGLILALKRFLSIAFPILTLLSSIRLLKLISVRQKRKVYIEALPTIPYENRLEAKSMENKTRHVKISMMMLKEIIGATDGHFRMEEMVGEVEIKSQCFSGTYKVV